MALPPESQPEPGPAGYSFEDVTRLAQEAALEHGSHVATVITQGDGKAIVAQFPDLPETHEERRELMSAAGATLAQTGGIGTLGQVFFIGEGWMSTAQEDTPIVSPPSQDPNRVEILFIYGLQVDTQQAQLASFEMVRDDQDQLVELKELTLGHKETTTLKSPLLVSFVEGFHMAAGEEEQPPTSEPLFPLGQIVATPGAMESLKAAGQDPLELLLRHVAGDWSELDEHDRRENKLSVEKGFRILSAYTLDTGEKVWVITEADRSVTTILLPSEY